MRQRSGLLSWNMGATLGLRLTGRAPIERNQSAYFGIFCHGATVCGLNDEWIGVDNGLHSRIKVLSE